MRSNANQSAVEDSTLDGSKTVYFILGGGELGEAIARRLQSDGYSVRVVDETYDAATVPGHRGDPADRRTLEAAGLSSAVGVIVATDTDSRNLLIAQLVAVNFDVDEVVVLVNGPERGDAIEAVGYQTICATTALSSAVATEFDRTEPEPTT